MAHGRSHPNEVSLTGFGFRVEDGFRVRIITLNPKP